MRATERLSIAKSKHEDHVKSLKVLESRATVFDFEAHKSCSRAILQ